MISRTKVTRRNFLASLAYLIGSALLGLSEIKNKFDLPAKTDVLSAKLASFYDDKDSAKTVGLEYLQSVASEANADLLVDLICLSKKEQRAELAHADIHRLRKLLRRQLREDFEQGRVTNVRGWILSQTECRLCALATLV